MFKNKEFKVGDEVVDMQLGNGFVSVANGVMTEVNFTVGVLRRYYLDGKYINTDIYPLLFHTDNNPFEMAVKWQERNNLTFGNNNTENQFATETPIEELKEGDSVFCVANGYCVTKGNTYHVARNYGDGISVFDDDRDKHDFDWIEAKQFFTTIPPVTPKPKINRAELLDVASKAMVALIRLDDNISVADAAKLINIDKDSYHWSIHHPMVIGKMATDYATALLNEVNKVTYATN